MELTEGSEMSANHNLTPGKYPKEHIQYSKHGESLKSRTVLLVSKRTAFLYSYIYIFLLWRFEPIPGHGLPLRGAPRSHSDTPASVGLLWTREEPKAETSIWQHTTLTTETSMPPSRHEPTIPESERPQTPHLDRAGPRSVLRVGGKL
jgi:hypothetical protein